jgi:hypothetical protein
MGLMGGGLTGGMGGCVVWVRWAPPWYLGWYVGPELSWVFPSVVLVSRIQLAQRYRDNIVTSFSAASSSGNLMSQKRTVCHMWQTSFQFVTKSRVSLGYRNLTRNLKPIQKVPRFCYVGRERGGSSGYHPYECRHTMATLKMRAFLSFVRVEISGCVPSLGPVGGLPWFFFHHWHAKSSSAASHSPRLHSVVIMN